MFKEDVTPLKNG